MKFSLLSAVAGVALVAGCSTTSSPNAVPGAQTPNLFHKEVRKEQKLAYLLYVPKEAKTDSSKKWPLVLFLHGAGERGTNLNAVAVHGPPKLVAAGREFPFILASPQCPANTVWDTDTLAGLLDELQASLPVDAKRVYVTGLSMGGYGSWAMALKYPDRFAAVAPVCGGGERIRALLPSQRESLKTLGVWAFHGAKDNVVPISESERMVEAFKNAGVKDIRLTVYPEAGHDSWTAAYEEPVFFDWLLSHAR